MAGDMVNFSDFKEALAMGIDPTNNSLLGVLPPEILSSIETMVTIFKAVGIIFLIYLILLIIQSFFNIRRSMRIREIHRKIMDVDEKLDILLEKERLEEEQKKKKIEKIAEEVKEKHEKRGFFRWLFGLSRKSKVSEELEEKKEEEKVEEKAEEDKKKGKVEKSKK